jgi:hypothetical protein
MHVCPQSPPCFEEHSLGIEQSDSVPHARGEMVQEVGKAVGVVFDRLRHFSYIVQSERVPCLDQLPASLRELDGLIHMQHREAESLRERSGARTERIRTRHSKGAVAAISRATDERILLPGTIGW